MAKICGVSQRTILRDIDVLREKYIRYVGKKNVGYGEIIKSNPEN